LVGGEWASLNFILPGELMCQTIDCCAVFERETKKVQLLLVYSTVRNRQRKSSCCCAGMAKVMTRHTHSATVE